MTTTDPATPGEALRWYADRFTPRWPHETVKLSFVVAKLQEWARAAELDAAPAAPRAYDMPPAPGPEVTDLWDREGARWRRVEPQPPYGADWAPWELLVDKPPQVSVEATDWAELVYCAGPLSSVPPVGTPEPSENGGPYIDTCPACAGAYDSHAVLDAIRDEVRRAE